MSLYAIGQRVWCKSHDSLGIVTEANYTPKAVYVIDLVGGARKFVDGKLHYVPTGRDWMCGSSDLRAADFCCDGCGRWLPGFPHGTAPDGEYANGLGFCFLCCRGRS